MKAMLALLILIGCGEVCTEHDWMIEKAWSCYCEDDGAGDYCSLHNPREWWCAPKLIMLNGKCVFECDYFAIEVVKINLNDESYYPEFSLEQVQGRITCVQDP